MQRKPGRELYLCSEMVGVLVNPSRSLPANLEEVSEHSLVMLLDEEIPRGSNIQIVCKSQNINGVVETITPDELLGWYVRVRLTAGAIDLERFLADNITSFHAVYAPELPQRVVHQHSPRVARTRPARVPRIPARRTDQTVRAVQGKGLPRLSPKVFTLERI
jgi:hypothetical protein